MKWTKKAALKRMKTIQGLQEAFTRYPLAILLVESAAKLKRYPGYHRSSCYYAYKDWMWAAVGDENKAFWTCMKVIDDLLPPDVCDLELVGECISTNNPSLPGLPPKPNRPGSTPMLLQDQVEEIKDEEHLRLQVMRKMLEEHQTGVTFTQWLLSQVNKNDPVGDLARDVSMDEKWPKVGVDKAIYRDYLDSIHAYKGAVDAFNTAWTRYKAYMKVQTQQVSTHLDT